MDQSPRIARLLAVQTRAKEESAMDQGKERRGKLLHPDPKRLCQLARMADEEHSDVLGSYTGTGLNGEEPEQDADDL